MKCLNTDDKSPYSNSDAVLQTLRTCESPANYTLAVFSSFLFCTGGAEQGLQSALLFKSRNYFIWETYMLIMIIDEQLLNNTS